jgi:hypothetical protein
MPERVALLHAAPHQWGPGKVHLIDTARRATLCGRNRDTCPGRTAWGSLDDVSCHACLTSRDAAQRQAERTAERQRQDAEYQRQREAADRQWRAAYDAYLRTGAWITKRQLVLQRAGHVCEGCGVQMAVAVHHLRYPRDCLAGSAEWQRQEKLWDLRATCEGCHEDMHPHMRTELAAA